MFAIRNNIIKISQNTAFRLFKNAYSFFASDCYGDTMKIRARFTIRDNKAELR